jgi:hypothetical protein
MTCIKKGTINTLSIHKSTITINMNDLQNELLIYIKNMITLYPNYMSTVIAQN